jgi:tetratricopeptide (TPR) repeat protein
MPHVSKTFSENNSMQNVIRRKRYPCFLLIASFFMTVSCGCASAFSRHLDDARGYIGDAEIAGRSGEDERVQELCGKALQSLARAEEIGANEPELPIVVFMQGYAEGMCGRPEKALEKMARAVELDPKDTDFRAEYGSRLCAMGEHEIVKGDKAKGKKLLEEGRKHIERAVELDSKHGGARLVLAQAFYAEGNTQLARDHIKKGIELILKGEGGEAPPIERMAALYAQIGEMAGRAGDSETVEHYFRLAYETNPTERRHLGGYVQVLGASGKKENIEKARKLLKNALDADPNAGDLLDILGRIYFYLERHKEAIEVLERAHGLNALSFEGHCALAQLYDVLKRKQDAVKLLENYLEELKKAGRKENAAHVAVSVAHLIVDKPQGSTPPEEMRKIDAVNGTRAIKALESALEISPGNIELLQACGDVYLLMRRIPEARKIADRIIAEGGKRAYLGRALYLSIYGLTGETAKAVETAMSAIEADPTLIPFYIEVTNLLHDKPDHAIEILKFGLKYNTDHPFLLDRLISFSMANEDYESAGKYAERLIETRPKDFIGYFYRGAIALAKGESDAANKALNDAIALAPNDEVRARISTEWSRIRERVTARTRRPEGFPDAKTYDLLKITEREKYIDMAMQYPTPEGLEFMKIALNDNDALIRTRAVQSLVSYNASDVEPLIKAALKDPKDIVRGIAVAILEKLELPGRLELLAGMLEDSSSYVRQAGIEALRRLTRKNFQYDFKAEAEVRAKAVERWKKYIAETGK